MKTFIEFTKISALGNDFILINDINNTIKKYLNSSMIYNLCSFHTGIGADGLIIISPDSEYDFRMFYFNSDGNEAMMCGNGARSAAYFAYLEHISSASGRFRASDGLHQFTISDSVINVSLNVTDSRSIIDKEIENKKVYFINTGVPHGILFVKDIKNIEVNIIGKKLRDYKGFDKKGANINFVQIIDKHNILIRTFERGIEGETLSCGTGSTAAAIVSYCKSFTNPPINAINKSNEILKIDFKYINNDVKDVTLEGNVKVTFKGIFDLYEY